MYKVLKYFVDLQDNKHPYNVGDSFPREGLTVSGERINELSGSNNKQKQPLIAEVEFMNKPEVEEVEAETKKRQRTRAKK